MAFPLRARIRTLVLLWLFGISGVGGLGSVHAALPVLTQPGWAELTPQQRQTLAPLAREWNAMEAFRRKTWLGIAARYEKMSPEEQARVQKRMREWAKLAPEERKLAREKYQKTLKKMDSRQREALKQNWEDYNALPIEEKQRLKDKAVRRPPVSIIPPPSPKAPIRRKIAPSKPNHPAPSSVPEPAVVSSPVPDATTP